MAILSTAKINAASRDHHPCHHEPARDRPAFGRYKRPKVKRFHTKASRTASDGSLVYTCGACPLTFPTLTALQSHVSQRGTGHYLCDICDRFFFSFEGMQNHKRFSRAGRHNPGWRPGDGDVREHGHLRPPVPKRPRVPVKSAEVQMAEERFETRMPPASFVASYGSREVEVIDVDDDGDDSNSSDESDSKSRSNSSGNVDSDSSSNCGSDSDEDMQDSSSTAPDDDLITPPDSDPDMPPCQLGCRSLGCRFVAPSQTELERHISGSAAHHWCKPCDSFFKTWSELDTHHQECVLYLGESNVIVRAPARIPKPRPDDDDDDEMYWNQIPTSQEWVTDVHLMLTQMEEGRKEEQDVDMMLIPSNPRARGRDTRVEDAPCDTQIAAYDPTQQGLTQQQMPVSSQFVEFGDSQPPSQSQDISNMLSVSMLSTQCMSQMTQSGSIKCPTGVMGLADDPCKRAVGSIPAAVMHLESGACNSNLYRLHVNRFVDRCDKRRVITVPGLRAPHLPVEVLEEPNAVTWDEEGHANGRVDNWVGKQVERDNGADVVDEPEGDWVSGKVECLDGFYYCPHPKCDREKFRSLRGLEQHLESPVHDVKMYQCPGSGYLGCHRTFNTLSGLLQHIKFGSNECGGMFTVRVKNKVCGSIENPIKVYD